MRLLLNSAQWHFKTKSKFPEGYGDYDNRILGEVATSPAADSVGTGSVRNIPGSGGGGSSSGAIPLTSFMCFRSLAEMYKPTAKVRARPIAPSTYRSNKETSRT